MSFVSDLKKAEQLWAATMDMATQLKKEGVEVDLSKLKTSRLLLIHCKTDPHLHFEELNEAREIIEGAQVELSIAAESLGQDFISKWEEDIKKVTAGENRYEFSLLSSKFAPGLPRDSKWVRINIAGLIEVSKMEELVKSCGAKMERQDDEGYVLITGEKDSVKCVLDAMSKVIKK